MTDTTHDPDDPRYTTIHGGVQLPNTHDPMCARRDGAFPPDRYCDCDLIARVRADERERAAERVAALTAYISFIGDPCVSRAYAVAAARGET